MGSARHPASTGKMPERVTSRRWPASGSPGGPARSSSSRLRRPRGNSTSAAPPTSAPFTDCEPSRERRHLHPMFTDGRRSAPPGPRTGAATAPGLRCSVHAKVQHDRLPLMVPAPGDLQPSAMGAGGRRAVPRQLACLGPRCATHGGPAAVADGRLAEHPRASPEVVRDMGTSAAAAPAAAQVRARPHARRTLEQRPRAPRSGRRWRRDRREVERGCRAGAGYPASNMRAADRPDPPAWSRGGLGARADRRGAIGGERVRRAGRLAEDDAIHARASSTRWT